MALLLNGQHTAYVTKMMFWSLIRPQFNSVTPWGNSGWRESSSSWVILQKSVLLYLYCIVHCLSIYVHVIWIMDKPINDTYKVVRGKTGFSTSKCKSKGLFFSFFRFLFFTLPMSSKLSIRLSMCPLHPTSHCGNCTVLFRLACFVLMQKTWV